MKRLSLPIAALLAVTACAPVPSQQSLTQETVDCAAGNQWACGLLPALQAQVTAEKQQQEAAGAAVAGGILIGLAAILIGATGGGYYHPVTYHRRWH